MILICVGKTNQNTDNGYRWGLARSIRLHFLGMHRKETKQHKWTLNNFNPYKTLGVGDQKLIATYVPTANIKKIIIIKEISLGWHEKKAIGGLCQRFNVESNKQWQQQSLGETCPQMSATALCKGQVGRQDIDTWTCWSPLSKQFLQLVMRLWLVSTCFLQDTHVCVCVCICGRSTYYACPA